MDSDTLEADRVRRSWRAVVRILTQSLAILLTAFAVAQPARADTPSIQLFLNHFFRVLDYTTFNALTSDPFINHEFSHFSVDHVTSGSGAWTGAYLEGQSTYIELSSQSALPPAPGLTSSGGQVNFGVEEVGEADSLLTTLDAAYPALGFSMEHDTTADGTPWMKGVNPASNGDGVSFGILEYELAYMQKSGGNDIRRQTYNAKSYDSSRYLKNVSKLFLELTEEDQKILGAIMKSAQYKETPLENGIEYTGPEIVLHVTSASTSKILAVELSLNRIKQSGPMIYKFGNAALKFEGQSATLTF
jgi:hypothetical protein